MSNTNSYRIKTFSGLLWRFGERIGAQLVSTIVSIILARLLFPEDYAVIALTTTFITLCNVFVTSGFGSALIQKKNADETDYSSVFFFGLFVSSVLYLILFFCSPYIASFYEVPLLSPVLRVLGLRLPISALGTVQEAYVSKHLIFKKFFWATLLGNSISAVIGIWMAYSGYGVWALVAQNMSNIVINKIMLLVITHWWPTPKFSFVRVKTLFSYSSKLLISGLLETGYNELRSLIIGKRYSPTDLAYYTKGKSLPSLLGDNINGPINSVLFPVMSQVQDEKERIKAMTRRSIRTACFLILPIMTGLAVIAPTLVPFLFTEKWNASIPYMQILCFVYALMPIHTANLQAIKALGHSNIFLRLEIIKKSIGVVALLVSLPFGVFWMIFSSAITGITSSIINAWPNKKLLHYGWLEQIKDILPACFLSITMGIVVYFMNYIPITPFLRLLLQVTTGITIYFLLAKLFRVEEFRYLLATIKSFFRKKQNISRSTYDT